MRKPPLVIVLATIGILASASPGWAQDPYRIFLQDVFPRGAWDVQVMGGAYHSVQLGTDTTPYYFAPVVARVGIITDLGFQFGTLQVNFEPMLEIAGATVWGGTGTYFVGPSVLLRYNFSHLEGRLFPYFQVGAGVTFNDGYRNRNQTALGQEVEFILQAQVGLRWFVCDRISLDMEGGLIHISNAGMDNRNHGVNALGASFGMSFYLGGSRY